MNQISLMKSMRYSLLWRSENVNTYHCFGKKTFPFLRIRSFKTVKNNYIFFHMHRKLWVSVIMYRNWGYLPNSCSSKWWKNYLKKKTHTIFFLSYNFLITLAMWLLLWEQKVILRRLICTDIYFNKYMH